MNTVLIVYSACTMFHCLSVTFSIAKVIKGFDICKHKFMKINVD